ncbi:hypothetical protein [Pseudomonas aeruginosa]|uniref:hypothetical protein n=1 Tax=Pseudomonas aeruginosa TaxID=287 RepID=UPI00053EA036|nr:hypothetical protein [Pseudomonas aeruginosa]
MSIDWSKAPEGATHWEPRGSLYHEGWMKKVGNKWSYWAEGRKAWISGTSACNVSAEREEAFEARPQEDWDGQGLPPVGAKCLTDRNDFLREVTILCHGKTRTFVFDHVSQEEICLALKDRVFLPIRTPEQIAAEEREKAINQMISDAGYVDPKIGTFVAMGNLYDAGYRRQESST